MNILQNIIYEEKENAEKHEKIYSSGKISDSPGYFGYEKTKRIDQ